MSYPEVGPIMRTKSVLITAILVLLVVAMSGCTSSVSNVSVTAQTSQAQKYAQAFVDEAKKLNTDPNVTLTSKIVENGSDAIQLTATSVNATKTAFYANGSTTTIALNIKQFASKADAEKFYNTISFGYTSNNNMTNNVTKLNDNPYFAATGKNPTETQASWKLDSFNFVTMSSSLAVQQDEFVMWGTVSVMSGRGST